MDSVERVKTILRYLTWIPLSTLEVVEDEGCFSTGSRLVVTMKVFDTYNPTEPTAIVTGYAIPTYLRDNEHALRWIRTCLQEIARHECDEWIVFAGVRPFDPHTSLRST